MSNIRKFRDTDKVQFRIDRKRVKKLRTVNIKAARVAKFAMTTED